MTKEQQIYREANKAGQCGFLKGTEKTDDLIRLFFTAKGKEFCTTHNVPSLDAFLRFRGLQAARGGFYIETPVKAKNLSRVALIGSNTVAELEYDNTDTNYNVVLMHGAKARITASNWAVVFVTNAGGEVEVIQKDNAKIFQ
jgi:hypothetical protein